MALVLGSPLSKKHLIYVAKNHIRSCNTTRKTKFFWPDERFPNPGTCLTEGFVSHVTGSRPIIQGKGDLWMDGVQEVKSCSMGSEKNDLSTISPEFETCHWFLDLAVSERDIYYTLYDTSSIPASYYKELESFDKSVNRITSLAEKQARGLRPKVSLRKAIKLHNIQPYATATIGFSGYELTILK